MISSLTSLWNDEAGFIVSAELVLIATIAVLAMVVGLSELAFGVNEELEDVGTAVAVMNQSYVVASVSGTKAHKAGSAFRDRFDICDGEFDITCDAGPRPEAPKY